MTKELEDKIHQLHEEGKTNIEIASITGLSKDCIRMFLVRHPVRERLEICKHCGAEIKVLIKGIPHFCSYKCKNAWYHHRRYVDPRLQKDFVCLHCGETFKAYKGKDRKYCSFECSHLARRKKHEKQ